MHRKQIVRIINGALKDLPKRGSTSPLYRSYIRSLLPYAVIHEQAEDGSQITVVVNRDYKPLGVSGYQDLVSYSDYVGIVDNSLVDKLKMVLGGDHPRAVFLYQDGNAPWLAKTQMESYLKRLDKLLGLLRS
ncbi:hypothetical protein [Halopseudomonas pertucinogena]|uniref:Uncharacterized protein n=1 Tax=Halopseudomonas pertucinogena TaxID=86175 RepID=A0ABQ2CRW9_9GAMM|nr:hypothetical protein [Halopseudomonas pertucinogena]GGJ06771.1 hypothetical protein GCM10009083_24700 [Halopseudomonas pertucinogena]